jgi:hypothetical protein
LQLSPSITPKPAASAEFSFYNTTQYVVLDSSLFKKFGTRAIIASEIKKLKTEFEKFNNSSLFQNVDWNQFWDNTKVQKQLEAAFAQLKALELRQKNNAYLYATGTGRGESNRKAESSKVEEMDLSVAANKKLAIIVNGRILDIKLQQATLKVVDELNYHFDLPDFSQLETKIAVAPYSYTFSEKPRTVVKGSLTTTIQGTLCNEDIHEKEVHESTQTFYTGRQNFIISAGGILSGKARAVVLKAKVLKAARI